MELSLKGVFTAMVTPFDKRGEIDEEGFRRLVDFQIENGIGGIVPCGTTGESPTLTHKEHDRVIEMAVEQANKRVPVIAGTGSNSTAEAIRLSRQAEKAGVDGVMVVNPYYNKPTQKGLFLHFSEIANSIDLPCVIYNIKGRTSVNLETDTLMRLSDACPNILAVKEASGDIAQMRDVISRKRDNFHVLSGDDNMVIDLVELGGDGVISVASNIIPKTMVEMVQLALNGEIAKARSMEKERGLADFFKTMFVETNPIPIKTAMAMAGRCQESFRLPMCSLEKEEHRSLIEESLKRIGVLGS
jgi:4-hydroxy-tetrahydrodipicolinate synthase